MSIARIYTRAQIGITAPAVTVETHVATSGLPQILIVGLPETTVKEAKDRVRAAIMNSGLGSIKRKATVNLAPAHLPKQGSRYDAAIAVTLIAADDKDGWSRGQLDGIELLGELALDGSLRDPGGVLPAAVASSRSNRLLIVPRASGAEAALAGNENIRVADTLADVCAFLQGACELDRPDPPISGQPIRSRDTIADIRGQQMAKRALMIAAAGGHNLLLVGPPGTGKTMLASRLGSLLPALDVEESLDVASIRSVSKYGFDPAEWGRRPFRNPHHTASAVALVGGGSPPRPGEISLAHNGVLFLDELPEYPRSVLEVLREPLESGEIIISRANQQARFPSRFQLIAAMNPCPCGYLGDTNQACSCGIDQVDKYRTRISGPLMDRIDLHVDVPPLPAGTLTAPTAPDPREHEAAVKQVREAREAMLARGGKLNAWLTGKEAECACTLSESDRELLEAAIAKINLSARAYYKVLKVARTIADVEGETRVGTRHLHEAIGYRKLDRYKRTAL